MMVPYTSQLWYKKRNLVNRQKPTADWFEFCKKTSQRTQTLYNFRQEVCSSFGLLYPVALHDLAITVDTDIPATARLGLTIEHGRVCNIVVLKHALLELTLRSEVLLRRNMQEGERVRGIFILANKASKEICKCHERTVTLCLNINMESTEVH